MTLVFMPLSQGKVCKLDFEDYVKVKKGPKWGLASRKNRNASYAVRAVGFKPHRYVQRMHRLIMNAQKGEIVDHINGDGLNNVRDNLRIVTESQNCWNSVIPKNNKTGFKGVFKLKGKGYTANISVFDNLIYLGTYSTKEEAAVKYNHAAIKSFKEYANLNDVDMSIIPKRMTTTSKRKVKNLDTGEIYESMQETARHLNITVNAISVAFKSNRTKIKNYNLTPMEENYEEL